MKLRITTFNVQNMFNRYAFLDQPFTGRDFEQTVMATGVVSLASQQGDLVPYATTTIQRNNTALAILDAQPDILAVQEIENIYTLRNFNEQYLGNYFGHVISIDGNDPRGIDVGLLIKRNFTGPDHKDLKSLTVGGIRTHIDEAANKKEMVSRRYIGQLGGKAAYLAPNAIFSRDCLEVDVVIEKKDGTKKTLTLLVNHLKSQLGGKPSDERRLKQSTRVAAIVNENVAAGRLPVVLGDLNADASLKNGTSVHPLTKHPELQDPFGALPKTNKWTHFLDSGGGEVSRLDYVLPHKSLVVDPVDVVALDANTSIVRKGLSTKCHQYPMKLARSPTIGPVDTEASDHCPVIVTLEL